MLGLNRSSDTKPRTWKRGVSFWGTCCGAVAVLMLTTGCPPTPPCETDADCDDQNGCTADTCVDMVCSNSAQCDDDHCVTATNSAGESVQGCVECIAASECDDDVDCTTDACTTGACSNTADDAACDDDIDCTVDSCDATAGCSNNPDNSLCDDDEFCNGVETCNGDTGCVDGVSPCDPDTETCAEATDECLVNCTTNEDCDDGLFCTVNTCTNGVCLSTARPCDDNQFCTGSEMCNETTDACESAGNPCPDDQVCDEEMNACAEGTACTTNAECPDDGLFCTGAESCDVAAGFCVSTGDPCVLPATCNEDLNTCDTPAGPMVDFTLAIETATGTGGDNLFRALLAFNPQSGTNLPTLSTGDTGVGGDGEDSLNPAQFNFTAGTTVSPTLTSIESITINDFGTAATILAGGGVTGATEFNFVNGTNTNAFTVNNLPTLADIGITNQAVGATVVFQTAATAGAMDALTLSLNGLTGAGSVVTITSGTTNGVETLNVDSSGVASSFSDIAMNGTTLTTVNVSGDASLRVTTSLDANVTTVNASGSTGGVNLTQTNLAGAFTFTGGAGNDTLLLGNTYAATDTVNGGAGTDTLGANTAQLGGTAAAQTNVTNFEALRVQDSHTTALNLAHYAGVNSVTLDLGSNAGTITNGATGLGVSCGVRAGMATGGGTLASTVSGSATTDTATYTLNDCGQAAAVTFNGVETLNLVSNLDLDGSASDSMTAGVNTLAAALILTDTAALERINITGTESLTITGAITANEINASTFTEAFVMGAATTTVGVTVTGGAGNDTLFGSSGNDIVGGGGGTDIINAGDGNDIISGGALADTFRFTAGDLSAAPSDTIFDTVTDFGRNSDIFDETAGDLVIISGSTAAAGTAAINGEGIASFNAADDTLAERIVATEAGINASGVAAARQFAVFEHGGNSYVFVSDGVDGIGANDVLFQLTGVTGLSDTTLTTGNLTIN